MSNQTTGEGHDLAAAARTARDVLRQVSKMRGKIGPIATAAQQAAWQISAALGDHPRDTEIKP